MKTETKNGNKKHRKTARLVAAFLSFCLVLGNMPVTVYADSEGMEQLEWKKTASDSNVPETDASGDAPADVPATDGQELQSTQTDASGDSAAAAGEQSAQNTAGPAKAARVNAAESTEEGATESTEGETTESTAGHQHTQNTQHTVCGSESADEHTYQKAVAEEDPDTNKMEVNYDNISISHNDINTWEAWGDGNDETTSLPSEAGYYYLIDNVTLSSTWTVNKEIYICLNGYSITGDSGADNQYLINVSKGGSLVLTDCNENSGCITNKRTSSYGGIFVASGGKFEMYGGNITGNTSGKENSGGGVCVSGGSFEMYGGEIAGNTAGQNYSGGGVCVSSGSFAMYGGKIAGNAANRGDYSGGGVYISGGTFKMYGGEISNNTAPDGGGVYVNSAKAFYMYGGKISDNKATGSSGGGGGVYVNSAKTFDMYGGEISENKANNNGGGVYNKGTFRMFDQATISGNYANYVKKEEGEEGQVGEWGEGGGGVYVFDSKNSKFTMYGGTISNNHSKSGGGVYNENNYPTFTMTAGEISGNEATVSGGGVYNGCFLYLEGGTISNNTASNGGGVFYTSKKDAIVSGVTISGNTASGNGGGIYNATGSLTISDAIISGNTGANGGGVHNGSTLTISNTTISGNTGENGGGVYNGKTLTISGDTTISGNTGENGGGLYNNNNLTMTGGTITGNTATDSGGGVYMDKHVTETKETPSTFLISENADVITISGNNVEKDGSVSASNVYVSDTSIKLTVNGTLASGSCIGVSTGEQETLENGGVYGDKVGIIQVTDDFTAEDAKNFVSDNGNDTIYFEKKNKTIDLTDHTHEWEYRSEGNKVTAHCKNENKFEECNYYKEEDSAYYPYFTLSFENNENKISYDENEHGVTCNEQTVFERVTGITLDKIYYTGREKTSYSKKEAPMNPGKYTASLTVGEGQTTALTTLGWSTLGKATVDFTITMPKLDSIAVVKDPNKKSYIYGEKFDITGAKVVGYYTEDGKDTKEVDVTDLVEYENGLTYGQTSVEVSYTDESGKKFTASINGISVTYLDATAEVSGTQGNDNWYISNVTVSAPDGYLIAPNNGADVWGKHLMTTKADDGTSTITATDDDDKATVTEDGTFNVAYALKEKDKDSGGLTDNQTVTIQKDASAPTGTIAIENRDYKWDQPWSEPKTDEDASGDASDENQENPAKDLPEENTEGETDQSAEGNTEKAAATAQMLSYANSKNVAKAADLSGGTLGGGTLGGGTLGGGTLGGGTLGGGTLGGGTSGDTLGGGASGGTIGGGTSGGSTVDPTGENKEESSQGDSNETSEDTTCKNIDASFMNVQITASDNKNGSGIDSVSYFVTDYASDGNPKPVETLEEMKALKWIKCTRDTSSSSYKTDMIRGRWGENDTQKEDKLILYVKITDVAGNETYLCTGVLKLSVKSPGSDDDTLDGDGNGDGKDGTGNKTGDGTGDDGTGDDGTGETTPPFVPPLITPATDKPVIVPPADEPDELNPTIPGTVVTEPAEPDEPEEPSVPDEPEEPYEPERRLEPAALEKPDETNEPDEADAWDGKMDPDSKQTGEPEPAAANPDGVSITAADDNGGAVTVRQKDDEPQTGDRNRNELLATVSMIAGLSYLMELFAERKGIRLRMTKTQKDQVIAHLIEWAKTKNGFVRRCTIVVIFGVLLFYYSVGKMEEEDARTVGI